MQMVDIRGLPLTDMVWMVESLIDRGFTQISSKKTGKDPWKITAAKPNTEDTES